MSSVARSRPRTVMLSGVDLPISDRSQLSSPTCALLACASVVGVLPVPFVGGAVPGELVFGHPARRGVGQLGDELDVAGNLEPCQALGGPGVQVGGVDIGPGGRNHKG